MKRLKLLIASPSTHQNGVFLASVQTDIEKKYRFLTSSIGPTLEEIEFPNPKSDFKKQVTKQQPINDNKSPIAEDIAAGVFIFL